MVVDEIKKHGQPAVIVKTFLEAAEKSETLAGKSGIIITMGAGETNKVADMLTE
jgi:UDP-N-acetylmuramate-alanine ligase